MKLFCSKVKSTGIRSPSADRRLKLRFAESQPGMFRVKTHWILQSGSRQRNLFYTHQRLQRPLRWIHLWICCHFQTSIKLFLFSWMIFSSQLFFSFWYKHPLFNISSRVKKKTDSRVLKTFFIRWCLRNIFFPDLTIVGDDLKMI